MSGFNRKGWTTVPAGFHSDGSQRYAAVPIGSPAHKRYMRAYNKWKKEKLRNNREFKKQLKESKKHEL